MYRPADVHACQSVFFCVKPLWRELGDVVRFVRVIEFSNVHSLSVKYTLRKRVSFKLVFFKPLVRKKLPFFIIDFRAYRQGDRQRSGTGT